MNTTFQTTGTRGGGGSNPCNKAELWEIINTGKLFLKSLERFAIENFPDDEGAATKPYYDEDHDDDYNTTMTNSNSKSNNSKIFNHRLILVADGDDGPAARSSRNNAGTGTLLLKTPSNKAKANTTPTYASFAGTKRAASSSFFKTNNRKRPLVEEEGYGRRRVNDVNNNNDIDDEEVDDDDEEEEVKVEESSSITPSPSTQNKRQKTKNIKRVMKGVVVYHLQTHKFYGQYESAAAAARSIAATIPGRSTHGLETGIGQVLNGKQKSCAGYFFKYADHLEEEEEENDNDNDDNFFDAAESTEPTDNTSSYYVATKGSNKAFTDKRPRSKSPQVQTTTASSSSALSKKNSIKIETTTPATATATATAKATKGKRAPPSNAKGPVIKYNAKTGQRLERYDSASKAAEGFVDDNPGSKYITANKGISRVLRGERIQYFGLYYRYENDTTPLPSFPLTSTSRYGSFTDVKVGGKLRSSNARKRKEEVKNNAKKEAKDDNDDEEEAKPEEESKNNDKSNQTENSGDDDGNDDSGSSTASEDDSTSTATSNNSENNDNEGKQQEQKQSQQNVTTTPSPTKKKAARKSIRRWGK